MFLKLCLASFASPEEVFLDFPESSCQFIQTLIDDPYLLSTPQLVLNGLLEEASMAPLKSEVPIN